MPFWRAICRRESPKVSLPEGVGSGGKSRGRIGVTKMRDGMFFRVREALTNGKSLRNLGGA